MTVVFASNYYNHHQSRFAEEMDALTGHNFFFLETMPMEKERRDMGWDADSRPDYVIRSYEPGGSARCRELIRGADAVIWGSCPFSMILPRLLAGKLTLLDSERVFKQGLTGFGFWGRVIKYKLMLLAFQKNHYLLCASAYAAGDYARMGLFRERAYKWGYFPAFVPQDPEGLIAEKQPASLLWVGRMLSWKHPELALETAAGLKQAGIPFRLEMIGCGPMEPMLREQLRQMGLEDCVKLIGAMSPDAVRRKMEKSSIFLATSDRAEGWGAVLNEAMNSGCAVVSSREIGAAPFLIEDGKNGLLYSCGDSDALYQKTRFLLEHPEEAASLGKNAYETIHTVWNARCASERLTRLIQSLADGCPIPAPHGPCSIAETLE